MDYCKVHFGKMLTQLKYDDLQDYFSTERIETDQLEFKSFSGNVTENYSGIIKTICGFLNSKGGLLIWGAPKGEKVKIQGRNEKIFKGEPTPITPLVVKDQCISKCSDSISPLPIGLRLNILSEGNSCICIFEVDESEYSPHQTDNIYYMRMDGQTKPAPHHYVEALFKKIKNPLLEGYLQFDMPFLSSRILKIHFNVLLFNWSPMQNIDEISYRVSCDNGVFAGPYSPHHHVNDMSEYRAENFKNVLHFGEPAFGMHTIEVDVSEHKDITILLSFGGANTPAKSSSYKFALAKMNLFNMEENLIERKENLSYKELLDAMGVTRESTLKGFLKR